MLYLPGNAGRVDAVEHSIFAPPQQLRNVDRFRVLALGPARGWEKAALGASWSQDGTAITALPGVAGLREGGLESRIVALQAEGAHHTVGADLPVVVVAEQGVADLRGLHDLEYVVAMPQVVHPEWHEQLEKEARVLPSMQGVGAVPPQPVKLHDGRTALLRAAARSDIGAIGEYIPRLSADDRQTRYMRMISVHALTGPDRLRRLYDHTLDYCAHAAFIALLGNEIVGVVHAFRDGDIGPYELSFSRRSELTGQGIGPHLMRMIIDWGVSAGATEFYAITYRTKNPRMRALFDAHGFAVSANPEDQDTVIYRARVEDLAAEPSSELVGESGATGGRSRRGQTMDIWPRSPPHFRPWGPPDTPYAATTRTPREGSMMVVDLVRRRALLSGLLAACAAPAQAAALAAPLRFGVVPHSSARVIVQTYQPLAAHLERELGQPVEIVTAPGFEAFGRQAAAQRYDLIMSTGPLARYLQVDSGYRPLVRYTNDFKSLLLVAADGRIRQPSDLVAGRVVMLGRTSTTGVWAIDWIDAQKVHDVEVRQVAAADSIAQLVLAGDAEAGVMSNANLLGLNPALRARLRVLAESQPLLGRVYMLSARLGTQAARFEAALLSYADTVAGRAHLARFELGGLRRIVRGDMESLDPMVARVRRELAEIREPDLAPVRRDLAARTRP